MSTADIATIGIAVDATQVTSATRELEVFDSTAKRLTATVKNFIGAWAGWRIVKSLVIESAMLNARFETMGIVMNNVGRQAGYSSFQMREYELSLRKTGIAMIEARTVLTRMAQAQLDLTKTSELARIAQDAAVIGNINSSEAFERMVHGIQSAQTETLRTIGINVDFQASYEKLAKTLKTSAANLDETQKAGARMNAVIEYGTRIAGTYEASMSTAGKQLQSMKRYVDDLKVKFGEVFNDALTAAVFGMTTQFKRANKEMDELAKNGAIEEWADSLRNALLGLAEVLNTVAIAAKSVGTFAGYLSTRGSINERFYDIKRQIEKDDLPNKGARLIALEREHQQALDAEFKHWNEMDNLHLKEVGSVYRAGQKQAELKAKQRADDLAREKAYLLALEEVRRQYSGYSKTIQSAAEKALFEAHYPGEAAKTQPATATGLADMKKDPIGDKVTSLLDSTLVRRTAEYEKILARLTSSYTSTGKSSAEYRQALELLAEQYADVAAKGDVFGDKMYRATDPKVVDFMKEQAAAIQQLESDIAGTNKQADEWVKTLTRMDAEMKEDSAFKLLGAESREAGRWLQEQVRELENLRKTGTDTRTVDTIRILLNTIAEAKNEAAEFNDMIGGMAKARSMIADKEQQLQAQVTAGLKSQTASAVELREFYAEIADLLETELIPNLEAMMDTEQDKAKLLALQKLYAQYKEIAAIGKQQGWFNGMIAGIKEYANATTDAFTATKDIVEKTFKAMEDGITEFVLTGKMQFGNLFDAIKKELASLLAKSVTKNIAGSLLAGFGFGGSGAASATASGGAGGVGDIFSIGSALGSAMSPGAISTGAGVVVGGIAESLGASSAFAGSLGAGVATALPWVGAIAALGSAFGLFGGKPSNKAAGGNVDLATGAVSNLWNMTGKKQASQQTLDARDALLQSIGGFSTLLGDLGGTTAIKTVGVDIGERDGVQFKIDGGPLKSYGDDPDKALGLLFDEMVAGTTGLEQHVQDLLLAFNGAASGMAQFAGSLLIINEYIAADPLTEFTEQVEAASRSLYQQLQDSRTSVLSLADAFDGSLDTAQQLATATTRQYQLELQLVAQIQQALAQTQTMFGGSIEQIKLSVMDESEKYDYYRAKTDELLTQLYAATDPASIAQLAEGINAATMSAYSLLSPEQQLLHSNEFVDYLTAADEATTERLTAAQDAVTTMHQNLADTIKTVMLEVADAMKAAAATPTTVDVNVHVDTPASVEVGIGSAEYVG